MNAFTKPTMIVKEWLAPADGGEGPADPSPEIRVGLIIAL